jgi:hypothetical protein
MTYSCADIVEWVEGAFKPCVCSAVFLDDKLQINIVYKSSYSLAKGVPVAEARVLSVLAISVQQLREWLEKRGVTLDSWDYPGL